MTGIFHGLSNLHPACQTDKDSDPTDLWAVWEEATIAVLRAREVPTVPVAVVAS